MMTHSVKRMQERKINLSYKSFRLNCRIARNNTPSM